MTRLLTGVALLTGLAALAPGQTFPFQLRVRQQENVFVVANNATLSLAAAAVGRPVTLAVTAIYQGQRSVQIPVTPQLLGSSAFSIGPIGTLPLTLQPNESFSFDVTFTPVNNARAAAQLNFAFVEAPVSASTPATGGFITLNLAGLAPDFTVSYALQADANVFPLADGGTLPFLPIPINTTSLATVTLLNRGSGPGVVSSIGLTGDPAFQLLGVPLLPGSLDAGERVSFGIRYQPRAIGSNTATLRIDFGGRIVTATLDGNATGAVIAYELIQAGEATSIRPNQLLTLADTAVGERTFAGIQARNTGNADATITQIAISGTGFALTDTPFLPVVLAPNDLLTFNLVFNPAQPGRATARLRIGNDTFDLSATGIGQRLVFSYRSGDTSATVLPGGVVPFPPVTVSQDTSLELTVRNSGTSTATITSIGVADTRSVFSVEGLPALPVTVPPDGAISFTLRFAPAVTGLSTAPLVVDSQQFTLSGFGTPPPPLPALRFTGASGAQQPFQQPSIGLTLAEPYPLPLEGRLTMTIDSEAFLADPAVLFATGGRVVTFTIAPNTRQAVFANGLSDIRLQTGTVAGTILITPSVATRSGLDLTPASPETLRLSVARAAPVILAVQISGRTADALALTISGFSTTRSLRRLEFQFQPVAGTTFTADRVGVDITADAAAYFASSASQLVGGQFIVTMPFTFRSTSATSPPSFVDLIQSVTVTASNEIGASSPVSREVR